MRAHPLSEPAGPVRHSHVQPDTLRNRPGGTRTPNRRFWRPVLYQLSYGPLSCRAVVPSRAPPQLAAPSGQGRNRTADTTIFSRVLYQLSYLAKKTPGPVRHGREELRWLLGPLPPLFPCPGRRVRPGVGLEPSRYGGQQHNRGRVLRCAFDHAALPLIRNVLPARRPDRATLQSRS